MGVGQRTQIGSRGTPRKRGRRRTVRTGAVGHGGGVAAPVMLVEGIDDLRLPLPLLGLLLPLLLAPGQGGAPPRAAAPLAGAVAAVVVEAGPRRRPGPVQHLPGGPPGLAAAAPAPLAGRRRAAAAGMRKLPIASSSSTTGRRTGPDSGGTSGSGDTAPVLIIQLVAGRRAVQNSQRAEDGRVGGTDRGGRVGVDQRVAGVRARRRGGGGDGGRTRLAANAFLLPLPPPRRGRGYPAAGSGRVERGGAVGLVGEAAAAAGGSGQHALAHRFCQLLLAAAAVPPRGAQGRLRCGIVLLVRVLFCHDIYGHK